jgi:hypothetical protein
MFNVQEEFTANVPTILQPAIYTKWRLASTSSEKVTTRNSEEQLVIKFTFKGEYKIGDTTYKGEYTHIEYNPGDDAKKATNLMKRIQHLLSKSLNMDKTHFSKLAADSWESFCKNYDTLITEVTKAEGFKVPLVDFKIVGSVYNGKRRASFPKYLGFICIHGEHPLTFSASELKSNAEYEQFKPVAAAPDAESSDDDDDAFDN